MRPPADAPALLSVLRGRPERRHGKVDNRPAAVRAADKRPIAVHSWGGHTMTVVDAGPGAFDALA